MFKFFTLSFFLLSYLFDGGDTLNCTSNVVDNSGVVGAKAASVMKTDGTIYATYFDFTSGDQKTWFVNCQDEDCITNTKTNLNSPPGVLEAGNSLGIKSDGYAIIASQVRFASRFNRLQVTECHDADCSSNTKTPIGSLYGGSYISLAMRSDNTAVLTNYNIVFGKTLDIVSCLNTACSLNDEVTVDSTIETGRHAALRLDSNGNPVIVYRGPGANNLRYAVCGNSDCTSGNIIKTIPGTANLGDYNSFFLDNNNVATITTYDFSLYEFVVVFCANSLCTSATTTSVGGPFSGQFTSVVSDSTNSGQAAATYVNLYEDKLNIAQCDSSDCTNNTISIVDNSTFSGSFNTLHQSPVTDNFVVSYHIQEEDNESFNVAVCS
ncbi:MAG: hypothetical protein AAF770_00095 [Bacteroidota bacterium]